MFEAQGSVSQDSPDKVQISAIVSGDLDAVCRLENLIFQSPWERKIFELAVDDPNVICLALRVSGELSGYLIAFLKGHELLIANLAVADQYRRMGLASRLILHILLIASEKGLSYAVLDVRESNDGAINLYSRFGFRVIGKRRGYYSSPPEDGLVMYLRLADFLPEESQASS
jgi:ribosomal-protein-alanine N-acetyltransferase